MAPAFENQFNGYRQALLAKRRGEADPEGIQESEYFSAYEAGYTDGEKAGSMIYPDTEEITVPATVTL